MIITTDNINIDYESYGLTPPNNKPYLKSYIHENPTKVEQPTFLSQKRPAIIICPGGGYSSVSFDNEGEPLAIRFLAEGYNTFVLNYSTSPVRFPGALLELSKTVATIRKNAHKFNIDPNKIIICGFSAGGHLAASLGVYWRKVYIQQFLGYNKNENKPNGIILGYPVISSSEDAVHLASLHNLIGDNPDQREISMFSLENQVNETVPPCFIWHTATDVAVPPQNSLLFAQSLSKHKIPYELHIYPRGDHGISLASKVTSRSPTQIVPECQNWIEMAVRFINKL